MFFIRRLSIKHKMIAIFMIAGATALLFAESILITYSAYAQKQSLIRELTGLAAVIGNNSKVILEFHLPEDGKAVLSNLDAWDSIACARIYDSDGEPLAEYSPKRTGWIHPLPDSRENHWCFEQKRMHVFHRVWVNREIAGTIYLQDDMRHYYRGIRHSLIALLSSVFLALAAAYGLSSRMQRIISEPILSLARTAQSISTQKDYGIRAVKTTEDEVGQLIDAFNDMLVTIQQRDVAIRESEHKYRTLIDNIPLKIFYKDLNSVYIACNANFARDLNITPDEIAGKTDYDFFPRENADAYVEVDRSVLRSGVPMEMEESYIVRDRQTIVQKIKAPIRDEHRNLKGLLGIFWDITDRKNAEDKIRSSLREKEVLLKEIHHRVKNNMQVIISLLRLQTRTVSDPRYLDMFRESQDRIRSMALVHETLYQSPNLADIDFNGYARRLVSSLRKSYGRQADAVDIQLSVEDVSLGLESAIPCGLIINELVSNAFKYAFPDERKGVIRIVLESLPDGNLLLEVSDNGVGLPQGFDIGTASSMGLHLVAILAEDQLKGGLEVDTTQGTRFRLRFQKHTYQARI